MPSGVADLINNCPCFVPKIQCVCSFPIVEFCSYSIDNILFATRHGVMCSTLVVEAAENLLQFIDGVAANTGPYKLNKINEKE